MHRACSVPVVLVPLGSKAARKAGINSLRDYREEFWVYVAVDNRLVDFGHRSFPSSSNRHRFLLFSNRVSKLWRPTKDVKGVGVSSLCFLLFVHSLPRQCEWWDELCIYWKKLRNKLIICKFLCLLFFISFDLYARVFEERFIVYCIRWYGLLSPYVIFTSNVYTSEDEKFYSYVLPVNAYL